MAFFTEGELKQIGFKYVGSNVKVSTKASIYNPEDLEIGNNSRIDDFCVISGNVKIGSNVHIAAFCLVAGGEKGIVLDDFSGLAYHVQVFSQSDDYSGKTMTNPTVPVEYKNETKKKVVIGKHSIVGAGSIVLPGVTLSEGSAIGAMSVVRKPTLAWSTYLGNPAEKVKNRDRGLLLLEKDYRAKNE